MSTQPSGSAVKRALAEIRDLRERLRQVESAGSEPIAIIGVGCRFPGDVNDTESFWTLLREGRDAITTIPPDRWDIDAYYDADPDAPGKMSTRWGGFVAQVDHFDAEFFGVSAREAGSLDPQQRMLLETTWQALEDAGIPPNTLLGSRTGVFVGIAAFDYAQLQLQANDPAKIDAYFATGGSHSVATGRISYTLGLKGPCIAVDTACSASLVAVHLACQSLRARECDMALTGGVSVLLLPELFVDFSKAHMMAADGRCKSFDAAADGYVRGEGCGMIALKRLGDAVAAGDRVLGLIAGSGINHDGRSSGLTAPNGPSQAAVIRSALEQGGMSARDVGYVEAHGTGTSLGDPIEVQALAAALSAERPTDQPLLIGSVKTNLGHLEAAAGIAGLIKALLCLRNAAVPRSLHFSKPNPVIPWQQLPVKVAAEFTPWPSAKPRVAGVSSFGFSGTNAHVVLQEYSEPERLMDGAERPVHVVSVSARSAAALEENASRVAHAVASAVSLPLGDIAYSLNAGRSHFAHRLAVFGRTHQEVAERLVGPGRPGEARFVASSESEPELCMMFSGQGSQYANMARALFETQPSFSRRIEECDAVLEPLIGRSLAEVLYSSDSESLLRQTLYAQPAIVSVQYALSELWKDWGLVPSVVMGHSLGEYSAAIAAGVLSLEDGLALVAKRASLVEALCPAGRMVAIRADEELAREFVASVGGSSSVAAVNGMQSTVVSGAPDDIERLVSMLKERGVQHQILESSRAFHNGLLEPALGELASFAKTLVHSDPIVPMVSNMTGKLFAEGQGPGPGYWAKQAREPVRFRDGLATLREHGIDTLLEIGATATLTALAQEAFSEPDLRAVASLRKGGDDWEQLLTATAALYVRGASISWTAFDADYNRRKVAVPGYAFQRRRHWYTAPEDSGAALSSRRSHVSAIAEPMALWRRAVHAGRRQAARVPIDLDLSSFAERWEILDLLTTQQIIGTLRELRVFDSAGESRSVAAIVGACGVLPMYEALLERWLDRLVGKELLLRDGDSFVAIEPLPMPQIAPALERARKAFEDAQFVVDYLVSCGEQLTAIIIGKQSALETLFPGGSRQTAVDLYRNWALSRYFNDIAAATVSAMSAELPSGAEFRALEIGGGTGGTTAAVLPELPGRPTRYRFTDVSGFFFAAAAKDFIDYPFVEYSVLDIERSPYEQGYGRNAFHAVIAANVLHATKDLGQTIDHVLSLLAPGGVLVLYEVTEPKSWIDTSVALIAGWATSTDGFRDNGPLLSAPTWKSLLEGRGFENVEIFPKPDSPAAVLGMSVIIARAPLDVAADELPASGTRQTASLAAEVEAEVEAGAGVPRALVELAEALPNERDDILIGFVRGHVAAVLRRDGSEEPVGRRQNLMDLGLDSLMAIELRNRLTTGLGLESQLPVSLIFDYPNIAAIAAYLDTLLATDASSTEQTAAAVPASGERQRAIEDLSDDDVEALLLKKLEGGES